MALFTDMAQTQQADYLATNYMASLGKGEQPSKDSIERFIENNKIDGLDAPKLTTVLSSLVKHGSISCDEMASILQNDAAPKVTAAATTASTYAP